MEMLESTDGERHYRGAVQANLDEPVLACGLLHPSGAELPDQFLLAVTATKVHAFRALEGPGGIEAGAEVAVWERSEGGELFRPDPFLP
jgi:hypothetical protein